MCFPIKDTIQNGSTDAKRENDDEIDALSELIRNITQLAAKSNGTEMNKRKQTGNKQQQLKQLKASSSSAEPPTTMSASSSQPPPSSSTFFTTEEDEEATARRIIANETTGKVAIHPRKRISADTSSAQSTTTASNFHDEGRTRLFDDEEETYTRISLERLFREPPMTTSTAIAEEEHKREKHREVFTEVDKDNKKIEVVYAERAKEATVQKSSSTETHEEKKFVGQPTAITEATTMSTKDQIYNTIGDEKGYSGVDDEEDGPIATPPEVTTPLTPTQRRQLFIKRQQQLRHNNTSSMDELNNATGDGFIGSQTIDLSISQKELARVADALKALRNRAAQCNNKCNGSVINGIVSNKCLNRTTTGQYILDRRPRVEFVVARTNEELAARARAANGRRLRKLRVCLLSKKGFISLGVENLKNPNEEHI